MLASILALPALVHRAVLLAAAAAATGTSGSGLPGLKGITTFTGDMKLAGISLAGLGIMVGAATYAFTNHRGHYTEGTGHKILVRACIGAAIMGIATTIPGFLTGLG